MLEFPRISRGRRSSRRAGPGSSKKDDDVKNQRAWRLIAAGWLVASLAACGGNSSSSTGLVRVVNATLAHPSLDLLVNSVVTTSGIAKDSVSNYVGVVTGSPTLQLNDAGGATALATLAPTISSGLHTTVVAYESNGTIKTSVLGDDNVVPAAGSALLRVFDAATDAGAVDIYVTATTVTDLTTVSAPTFSLVAAAFPQATGFLTFTPGTYSVWVTGAGNTADLRLYIASVTLTSQQLDTVLLTPTIGGVLVDGGTLVQQGGYAATRNTNARVRLAAAVSGGASVGATAGSVTISAPVTSPVIGFYTVVPAVNSLALSVNGASVQVPVSNLAAGSDSTLLVYGNPAAPTVSVIADDNHLPTSSSTYKMRLLNGLTGAVTPLTLSADFGVIAANVAPGTVSPYGIATGSATVRLDVTLPSGTSVYTAPSLNILNNTVFTMFMVGDAGAAIAVLRRDR
jgi:hypothetical protein